MRRSEKRSKKRLKVRKSEENVVNSLPQEREPVRYRKGMVNQLWRWDSLEDVEFK